MADIVQFSSSGKELYPPNIGSFGRPKYIVSNKIAVVQTAHSGATAGYFWLTNPLTSTKNVAIRRIVCRIATTTALILLTSPRIQVERMTFTGTLTQAGIVVTPSKLETAELAPSALVHTATTGITPAASTVITAFLCPAVMTAVGAGTVVVDQNFIPNISEEIILVPGEGIIVCQPDNGTASDTRIAVVDVVWEEYLR
jgi:hypothetical protein